jgi:histidine triad (HIT) family protein
MSDCIFCKIASKEIPADIIFEDDKVVAFMDASPVTKGHALLIPKSHSSDLPGTPDEDLASLIIYAKKIAVGVVKAIPAAGFNTSINTGAAAGQTVFHTHFHIIPRFANDGLKSWPHLESEPKTRAEMAAEIKKFL